MNAAKHAGRRTALHKETVGKQTKPSSDQDALSGSGTDLVMRPASIWADPSTHFSAKHDLLDTVSQFLYNSGGHEKGRQRRQCTATVFDVGPNVCSASSSVAVQFADVVDAVGGNPSRTRADTAVSIKEVMLCGEVLGCQPVLILDTARFGPGLDRHLGCLKICALSAVASCEAACQKRARTKRCCPVCFAALFHI